MTPAPFRSATHLAPRFGRLLDRSKPLRFRFNGRAFTGFAGDTLASALLAAGERVVSRSIRFRRPRGAAALADPAEIGPIEIATPHGRATGLSAAEIELFEGLDARSAQGWPSAHVDLGALADLPWIADHGSRLRPLGELLRRLAGRDWRDEPPPPRLESVHHAVDLLVVGAGLAGLFAAEFAAQEGLSVLVADAAPQPGGIADLYDGRLDNRRLPDAARARAHALDALPNARLLLRTRAARLEPGYAALLVERSPAGIDSRVHAVAAKAVVLASGARERHLVFPNNDRPGILQATMCRALLRRHGVIPGRAVVVATSSDEGYRTAFDLDDAKVPVTQIVDLRLRPEGPVVDMAKARGLSISFGSAVVDAAYRGGRLAGVTAENRFSLRNVVQRRELDCDCLVVSGGFDASAELATTLGAELALDPETALFRLSNCPPGLRAAGAAAGLIDAEDVVADGIAAGAWAAAFVQGGLRVGGHRSPPEIAVSRDWPAELAAPTLGQGGKAVRAFVDLAADLTLAATSREATAASFGALVAARAFLAESEPRAVRPKRLDRPAARLSLAAAAASVPAHAGEGRRRTPLDAAHRAMAAPMLESRFWRLPACYPRAGEDREDAVRREARQARSVAGLLDLGGSEALIVEGPAAEDLVSRLLPLPEGLASGDAVEVPVLDAYGEVRDLALVAVLAPTRFLVLSGAPLPTADGEDGIDAIATPATDRLATIAILGRSAREVLDEALPGLEPSPSRMTVLPGDRGLLVPGRIAGLTGFRLVVPAGLAPALWQRLGETAAAYGAGPIGIETLQRLHLEAGELAPSGLHGSPDDLGLAVADVEPTYTGAAALARLRHRDRPRHRLVGLVPREADGAVDAGALLLPAPLAPVPRRSLGRVVAAGFSPARGTWIGLALVEEDAVQAGDTVLTLRRETPVELGIVAPSELLGPELLPGIVEPSPPAAVADAPPLASEPAAIAPLPTDQPIAASEPTAANEPTAERELETAGSVIAADADARSGREGVAASAAPEDTQPPPSAADDSASIPAPADDTPLPAPPREEPGPSPEELADSAEPMPPADDGASPLDLSTSPQSEGVDDAASEVAADAPSEALAAIEPVVEQWPEAVVAPTPVSAIEPDGSEPQPASSQQEGEAVSRGEPEDGTAPAAPEERQPPTTAADDSSPIPEPAAEEAPVPTPPSPGAEEPPGDSSPEPGKEEESEAIASAEAGDAPPGSEPLAEQAPETVFEPTPASAIEPDGSEPQPASAVVEVKADARGEPEDVTAPVAPEDTQPPRTAPEDISSVAATADDKLLSAPPLEAPGPSPEALVEQAEPIAPADGASPPDRGEADGAPQPDADEPAARPALPNKGGADA